VVAFVAVFSATSFAEKPSGQADTKIWDEFLSVLKSGNVTPDRIRPYDESLKEPILGFLKTLREGVDWSKPVPAPEIFAVENRVNYVVTFTYKSSEQGTFCFTLLKDDGAWYFQHMESIFIRLDKLGPLPVSTFPDLREESKAWMREETQTTKDVRLFNTLAELKGREYAFAYFRDGNGYFLAARTWVPFVPTHRAFILYLCWEQANLRGNAVTLEKLDDHEAVVRMTSNVLSLYQRAAHLKQQIAFEDYLRIFESIWQDRGEKAGWKLAISYRDAECTFHFTR
jgi:hypothetical protein